MVEKIDPKEVAKVEMLLALKPHNAKPAGELIVRRIKPGEKYKQSGLEKVEAVSYGFATRNLEAKVPENKKRTVESAAKIKAIKPLHQLITEQNEAIVSALEKFGKTMELLAEKINKK
ncbi:MAG: hypothetical protein IPL84_03770 [Chitinophagaceae bacterium]|nr:hypothetical protein [Chitinophagaceae bacterium]